MKLLMFLVDGFEDTEAIATLDVISRGGDEVDVVSLMNGYEVSPKYIYKVLTRKTIKDVSPSDYDGLIIPGGPGSFKIMPNIPEVEKYIRSFALNGKLVASICAAPHLVGQLGFFVNRNYTVHPGFEDRIKGGNYLRDQGVVVDGNFITAKSMYYSIEFGLAIHEYFHGPVSKEKLRKACQGEGQ